MKFLSKAFRRKSDGLPAWAALDQESLRISAAMEHVQDHGNLDSFPGSQSEKLALMLTASRQGLVTWDREQQRYELTGVGRERLGMRSVLREPGEPMKMNLPPRSAAPARRSALGSRAIAAGIAGIAGLAIGAAAMGLLADGSSKQPPHDRAAVATAPKPADANNAPRTQAQAPAPAPRQAEASVARNPGIPCLADKCLETGGTAERSPRAGTPEQARNAPPAPPAPAAVASPKPEPPKTPAPPPPQQQAGAHPGQAGAAEGALAQQLAAATPASQPDPSPTATSQPAISPASPTTPATAETKPAPASKQARRTTPSQTRQPAPPPVTSEQPSYAQSAGDPPAPAPAPAVKKSSRTRHATEQRRTAKNRHDHVEEEGEPPDGVIVRRYPEQDASFFTTRRYRGEQDRRRGREEDRPGYAYREPPPFGSREGPSRFGLFDWLFH